MDLGAALAGLSDDLELARLLAPGIGLVVDSAVGVDLNLEQNGERVHHGHAHPVQPAGHLVGVAVEFTAGMQLGHDDFERRLVFLFVHPDGNTAAVVGHGDAVVGMNHDVDEVANPGHGLVDAVVHHLIDQVVQARDIDVADIHGRPAPHGFEAF